MSDNFNNIMDNIIRFIAGERPSADKFNALVAYFSQNSQELNNALGDIRGENNPFSRNGVTLNRLTIPWGRQIGSDDSVDGAHLYGRYLDIANIGRLIGPSSNLNNRYLSSGSFKIQNEKASYPSTEHKTKYPIFDEQSVVITKDGIPLEKIQPSESFSSASQYKYYNGSLIFSSLTNENTVIEYTTNPSNYGSGANYQGSRFNVIPDPNDTNKLDILAVEGGFVIELPFISAAQSSLNDDLVSNLNNDHVNRIKEDGTNQKYLLPKVLGKLDDKNTIEDAKANNQIPKYFLYLKCEDTEEVFLDADYYYMNESKIYVENIDLGNCDLNNDTFRIVTVGTDITTSIDDLRVKFIKHSHDGTFGEEAVRVQSLTGLFDNQTGNVYTKSVSSKNPLTSYLHRDGFDSRNQEDINANNMMRGHLVIGNIADGNQKPNSVSGTTYKLAFGRPANNNNENLLGDDSFVDSVATLNLDDNENLITRSASGKSLINYFQQSFRAESQSNPQIPNNFYLSGNNNFLENSEKSKLEVKTSTNNSIKESKISFYDISKTTTSSNTIESTNAIYNQSEYLTNVNKHYNVCGDVFELGSKFYNQSARNNEIEDAEHYSSRPERGLIFNSGKENIISGGLVKEYVAGDENNANTRSFLNLNSDLFRKERVFRTIGYDDYELDLVNVRMSNNQTRPVYVINQCHADIAIINWDDIITNSGIPFSGHNTVNEVVALNIGLDFEDLSKGNNYLRNKHSGIDFDINIYLGTDFPLETFQVYLRIFSFGSPIYSILEMNQKFYPSQNKPELEALKSSNITYDLNSNEWQSDEEELYRGNSDKGDALGNEYKGAQYLDFPILKQSAGAASVLYRLEKGSFINIKGSSMLNTAFNNSEIPLAGINIHTIRNVYNIEYKVVGYGV